jgi:uncharacterized protein YaaN involved in tellurite resistance
MMSEELKDFQTAPTLTLNPFAEEEKAQPEVKKEEPLMDENVLSEEERKMADQFANQIDLTNSAMILQYGAGTQSKMADFSETALENVKTKDLGEVGELLGNVVKELKNFDEEEEKGFFGIFKKQANKIQALKTKYAKAETNINQICQALEGHQVQLMKDVAILDKMSLQSLADLVDIRLRLGIFCFQCLNLICLLFEDSEKSFFFFLVKIFQLLHNIPEKFSHFPQVLRLYIFQCSL